jgi:hypothetical protein
MWPFTKKTNLPPGFRRDNQGNVMFELTEEERKEVQKFFDTCKSFSGGEFGIKKEVADEVYGGFTSIGLFHYAKGQIMLSELESNKSKRKEFIDRAVDSITKAFSFCPLPIFMYDLACFIEMGGKNELAKGAFEKFLELQKNFRPSQIQEIILNTLGRDIDNVIKHAEEKVK